MGKFTELAKTDEIFPGEGKAVNVGNEEIAIFNQNGQFYAIDNVCPHSGAPLAAGEVEDNIVICPWHGWQFDITNGKSTSNPASCLKSYPCKVEGDSILVEVE